MTRMECGFDPLNGIIWGIRVPRRKSKNVSPLTVPRILSTARIPDDDRHAMALIRSPLASRRRDTGLNPLNA